MRLDRSAVVNLGLLGLALISALLLIVTRERPTQAELDARAGNLIPEFRPARLVQLEIVHDGSRLRLSARPVVDGAEPAYHVGPNAQLEADPEAVRSLLRAIELAAFLKKLDAGEADPALLGLTAPRAKLALELEGARGEVRIGKPALTPKDATYVEVRGFGRDEPRLGLVRSSALDSILISEDSLRPRWIVPYSASEITNLNLKGGSAPPLELERSAGPAFRVKGGERVARTATDRFLLELSRARADRRLTHANPVLAPETTLRAELVAAGGRGKAVIELGNECPEQPDRFALRRLTPSAGAYCVDPGPKAALLELLANPADDAAFSLRADEVESLALKRDGKTLSLRRNERGFELESEAARAPVELASGNRLLEEIVGLRGRRVPDAEAKALGLEPGTGSITLRSSAIERTPSFEETVVLGKLQADGSLPLLRRHDGVTLLIAAEFARVASADASSLRPRRLLDFGPSDLRLLTLTLDGERERLKRTDDGVFELVEPRGFNHDASATLQLVQALGTLEADRWASDHDDGSFGFDRPLVRAEIELVKADKPAQVRLEVGSETGGGYFAKLDTSPGVFVLPKPLVHDLTTLLLARDVFVVDPSRLEAITLRVGTSRLELERHGDGFQTRPGTSEASGGEAARRSARVAPALIERVVALVTSLRAEAAIHTGPARETEGLGRPGLEIELWVATPAPETISIRIGSQANWRGTPIRFARRSGVDASYAISAASVREIQESL